MKNKTELLNRIARMVMLHASSMNNVGLLNGKLGVCIFFYRYSRFTGKSWYSDFADDLLDEIYGDIHAGYPANFKDGLPGICWGFEYIIRNQYVDADSDDILGELDRKITDRDIRQLSDVSLETGLTGIAHYLLSRCAGKRRSTKFCPDDYLAHLIGGLKTNGADQSLIESLEHMANGEPFLYPFDLLDKVCANNRTTAKAIVNSPYLGLMNKGITGSAYRILNELSV